MSRTTHLSLFLLVGLVLLSFASCCRESPSQASDPAEGQLTKGDARRAEPSAGVLAKVNGVPIRVEDVDLAISKSGHDKEAPAAHRKNVLEVIIRNELLRQRAEELDLDTNPTYQQRLRALEAQVGAYRRRELSNRFSRQELADKVKVSQAEAKKYFEDKAALIQTEIHVWQIMRRQEEQIKLVMKDLEAGVPFEKVAGKRYPKLPGTGRKPWDTGYLRWKQIPAGWREVVYSLEKGKVSGVIRGSGNRFWVVKLIDRRKNPDVTFEGIEPVLMDLLKSEKTVELRAKIDRDLRAKARIEYPSP